MGRIGRYCGIIYRDGLVLRVGGEISVLHGHCRRGKEADAIALPFEQGYAYVESTCRRLGLHGRIGHKLTFGIIYEYVQNAYGGCIVK